MIFLEITFVNISELKDYTLKCKSYSYRPGLISPKETRFDKVMEWEYSNWRRGQAPGKHQANTGHACRSHGEICGAGLLRGNRRRD